jgi:hypothetical protein
MAEVLTPSTKPVVGKFYMVPCVRLKLREHGHPARGRDGWIPIIGPEHHDREVIGFPAMHYHIDVRFLGTDVLRRYDDQRWFCEPHRVMGHPVSTFSDGVTPSDYQLPSGHGFEKALRRLQCKRDMPDFPRRSAWKWLPVLEEKHAACKLKPGNICPHRGIDLTPFIKEDGTVICPGHGLRWDTKTGDLLPFHPA